MKYRIGLGVLFWLGIGLNAIAQQIEIKGKVTALGGTPVEGASVVLVAQKKGALTNKQGIYQLKVAKSGSEIIKVSYVGFGTVEKKISLQGNTNLDFKLEPAIQTLNEVVVTGQYEPQSIKNSVFQVRVIDRARIEQRAATNLLGILNNELGFRFSNDMALGTTDIQLMGMAGRNVKILLDGVPMLDRGDTRESLNQIDINTIERIEIVEGPMSVNYGTDALAGVINIITKKPSHNQWSLFAKAQEETVSNEYKLSKKQDAVRQGAHNQSIGGMWQNGTLNVSAGLSSNNFGGWQGNSTGRSKEWLPKEQVLGHVKLGLTKTKGSIYYRNDFLHETITSFGNVNINTQQARDQKFITDRMMHQLQGELRISERLSMNALAAYTDYQRKTQTSILDLNTGKRTLSLGQGEQDVARFDNKMVRTTFQYRWTKAISLQPGFEVNIDNASGARIAGSPKINDYAFFVSSVISLDSSIQIRPGLRFIQNSVYDAPPVIPSINTKMKLNTNWDLRLAYARGFRSPALRELYFNFFDASHSIKGNPDLKAEESDSFNGSITYFSPKHTTVNWKSVLTGFYNDFRNLISYGTDPSDPSVSRTINIDRFKTLGTTLENTAVWQNLRATVGFSYIGRYNQLLSDEEYKTLTMPKFLWSPEVNANIMYTLPQSKTTLGLFYKYTGKRPAYQAETDSNGALKASLTEVAAYHWADFTLTQKLPAGLQASAGIKNLLNVTRLNNSGTAGTAGHSTSGPLPMSYGRSYFVGLTYNLTSKN
ncbi:TonB-dependent receptor [Flectobacillus major]|uniref:TonB-dependent receptor n=1 Tax=Flectobacillus major TaxID=103 RepID=UPI000424E162|nr:TonB-dependent receptor [Flectobacillus major]